MSCSSRIDGLHPYIRDNFLDHENGVLPIGRWQGILDTPLNDLGREQARKLAAYLANEPIQAVYTSDLSRAAETAQVLADALKIRLIRDERLRELDIGIFQGLTKPEILQQYPQEFAAFMAQPFEYSIPEGESRWQLQKRILAAWQDTIAAEDTQEIAIVSHGGALKMLLTALFPDKQERFEAQAFPNVSITVLEYRNNAWQLTELAKTSHLMSENIESEGGTVYF